MNLHTHSSGTGRDLFLLHGWGMNGSVWLPWLKTLTQDFRVTVVELPGHGESPWSKSFTQLATWAEQVLAVAPHDAVWVGWSLGGLVMQQAAIMHPEKIRAILGVASSPCFVQREDWDCAIDPVVLKNFAAELQADTSKTLRRFLSLQVQGAADAKTMLRHLQQEFAHRPQPHPEALQTGLNLLLNTDLRQQWANIELPTGWMLGDRDTLVPKCLAKALPQFHADLSVQLVSGAAHAPFLSHPLLCKRLLEDFIAHV